MRNLKKVLSLALALVMLLGMMVVGAGAATSFKDDSSIPENRSVAVAVANKIEVLLGDENGNFNPNDTLTRAEAAVVLAKLDLGADAAKALTATNAATFDDVGTGYGWAKAYIDYCAGNGYMVGVGGNKFAPGRTLTSVEFATMVSRVLGYKDENEYGKDGWTAVKAAALARKAGLGADVAVANTDMSRADMAQMVLNALTAPTVEYTGLNGSIGDATFSSPATTRKHANDVGRGGDYKNDPIQPNITPIRLCEEKFPNLKLNRSSEDKTYGRGLSVWTWKNVDIEGTETNVTPDAVFTKTTKENDVKKAINDARSNVYSSLYVNGKESSCPYSAKELAAITGNGRLVEVYLNENIKTQIDKVVVVDTALAEVTKVNNSDETISVKLVNSAVTDGKIVLNTKEGFGEVEKGDLVLVQGYGTEKLGKDSTITSVIEAPQVTGFARVKNYSSKDTAANIVMDGTTYYDAKGVMADYDVQNFTLSKDFDSTLYLDSYGNIMKAVEGADPKAVQDKLVAVKDAYKTFTDGRIVDMISGVISNGETVTWAVDKAYTANEIYTYGDPVNGKRELTKVVDSGAASGQVNVTSLSGYQVGNDHNSSTVNFKSDDVYGHGAADENMYSNTVKFIFVNSGANGSVTVVNGRQNFDFAGGTGKFYAQALNKDNEIIAVYVTAEPDVVDISNIIFVASRYEEWDEIITDKNDQNKKYYGYKAYTSDGEEIDHFLGVYQNMENKFYVSDKNDDGAYKNTGVNSNSIKKHTQTDGWVARANGRDGDAFTLTGGKQFIARSGVVVKDISNAKFYIESVAELNSVVKDGNSVRVAVIYNTTTAGTYEAKTIFVTEVKKGATIGGTSDVSGNVIAVLESPAAGQVTFVAAGKGTVTTSEKVNAIKTAVAKDQGVDVDLLEAKKAGSKWTITGGIADAEYTENGAVAQVGGIPNDKNVLDQAQALLDSITIPDESDPGYAAAVEQKREAQELVDLANSGQMSTGATATPVSDTEVKVDNISWSDDWTIMVHGFGEDFGMTLKEMYGTQAAPGSDAADRAKVSGATHWAVVPVNNKANNDTMILLLVYTEGKVQLVTRNKGTAAVTVQDVSGGYDPDGGSAAYNTFKFVGPNG